MKIRINILGAAIAILAVPGSTAIADTLEHALTEGKVSLDVRYRYEYVDQDNPLKNANASTVRSRLGYGTGSFYGISGYLELENITSIGPQYYNSGANGRTSYSIVGDPVGSQADQAYLAWEGPAATLLKLGRQVINLDNQRFVGRVDWRQNGQTFDALSLVNKALPDTVVTFAYLNNVDRVSATSARMDSELLNVRYDGLAAGSVTGYAYLLDYDRQANQSTQTYGLRFAGSAAVGMDTKAVYALEYAKQSNYASNPADYDLDYLLGELGGTWRNVGAKLGYELLEGDGKNSVQTPLATLHAFNGWADQFTSIPANGLKDAYLSLSGKIASVNLMATYHDFDAYKGGSDYGQEWDLRALRKFDDRYSLAMIYADYLADAAPGKVNTKKFWLIGQVTF